MNTDNMSISYFIPPYLKEFPLYQHLEEVIDIIINQSIVEFKDIEQLDDLLITFFGSDLTEDQKESVLMYYKVFIEPFLGTPSAIESLFNVLNLDAEVIVWFQNRVPLPPYKFNIEFSETPQNLSAALLLSLINLVKNERSHLASIKNTGSPDVNVWDYSSWDEDCWDNPAGIIIDGVVFNLTKFLTKHYDTGFNIIEEKYVNTNWFTEDRFKSNKSLNATSETNFDDDIWIEPKFNIQDFESFGVDLRYETSLIGNFNDDTLSGSLDYNRISMAKQVNLNYPSYIKMHINAYSKLEKSNTNDIIRIKNKTENDFLVLSKLNKPILLDKINRYKNDPTFNLKKIEIETPNLETLMPTDMSIFGVIKFNTLSSSLN